MRTLRAIAVPCGDARPTTDVHRFQAWLGGLPRQARRQEELVQFHVMRALRLQAIGSCLKFKWASF